MGAPSSDPGEALLYPQNDLGEWLHGGRVPEEVHGVTRAAELAPKAKHGQGGTAHAVNE
jgi:hypothetical protein